MEDPRNWEHVDIENGFFFREKQEYLTKKSLLNNLGDTTVDKLDVCY